MTSRLPSIGLAVGALLLTAPACGGEEPAPKTPASQDASASEAESTSADAEAAAYTDQEFAERFVPFSEQVLAFSASVTEAGEPLVFSTSASLCSPTSPATLTAVRAHKPDDGFEVESYAIRVPTEPEPYPSTASTLAEAGIDERESSIPPCGSEAPPELLIQVTRTGDAAAGARGFEIEWTDEEAERFVYLPLATMLCDADSVLDPGCDVGQIEDDNAQEVALLTAP